MRRHDLDPFSGLLGLLAVVAGGLVVTRSVDRLELHGAWIAIAAMGAIGLALLTAAARNLRHDDEPDGLG